MTRWLEIAHRYEGTKEVKGRGSNPLVLQWLKGPGKGDWVKDDATPWCGAFMAAVFTESGLSSVVPDAPLVARNWARVGQSLDGPKVGAICVVPRKDPNNPNAAHVAIVHDFNDHTLWLLGGNQGDAVSVATFRRLNRDGSERGIYRWPVPIKTAKDLAAEGSRIASRAKRVERDTAIGATSGTSPQTMPAVTEPLPSVPTSSLRDTVNSWVGDVSWLQSTMGIVGDFLTFAGARWPVVAVLVAAYFGGRVLWDTYLIKEARVQDANEGYST